MRQQLIDFFLCVDIQAAFSVVVSSEQGLEFASFHTRKKRDCARVLRVHLQQVVCALVFDPGFWLVQPPVPVVPA